MPTRGETTQSGQEPEASAYRISGLLRAALSIGLFCTAALALDTAMYLPAQPAEMLVELAILSPFLVYFASGLATIRIVQDTVHFRLGWLRISLRGGEVQRIRYGGYVSQVTLASGFRRIPIHPLIDRYADLYRELRTIIPSERFQDPTRLPLRIGASWRLRLLILLPWLNLFLLALVDFPDSALLVALISFFPALGIYLHLRPSCRFDETGVTCRRYFQASRYPYDALTELELFQDAGLMVLGLGFGKEILKLKGVHCAVAPEQIYTLLRNHLHPDPA